MARTNLMMVPSGEEGVYKQNGKKYVLSPEIVKGGCQGCAFYDRWDCHKTGRTEICNGNHIIFTRKLVID